MELRYLKEDVLATPKIGDEFFFMKENQFYTTQKAVKRLATRLFLNICTII